MTDQELINSDHWVKGPLFLWQEEDTWPSQPVFDNQLPADAEVKKETLVYHTDITTNIQILEELFAKYS